MAEEPQKIPQELKLAGPGTLKGALTPPGDKSVSHRVLLLGALAEGETEGLRMAPGRDVKSTARCLEELGVAVEWFEEDGQESVRVGGRGIGRLKEPSSPLDAGNSGTLTRILAGILAGHPFRSRLDGDESLRERPMERIAKPLREMGAVVGTREGRPPLEIEGGDLEGISYRPQVASAQVKSCLLLAGLHARGETTVIEPGPSRDHTERLLQAAGYPVSVEGRKVTVRGPEELRPLRMKVPGDFSSAAFFLAGAALSGESELLLEGVGLNETRTGFLDLLEKMGLSVQRKKEKVEGGEPRGDLLVRGGSLEGIEVDGEQVVRAIDELPLLAVVATAAEGRTVVREAEELRVKETDRIAAIVEGLSRMGAKIEAHPDGFSVEGPCQLRGASVRSFSDHRIAMSLAIASLRAEGETLIRGAQWIETSYPAFVDHLQELRK